MKPLYLDDIVLLFSLGIFWLQAQLFSAISKRLERGKESQEESSKYRQRFVEYTGIT